MNNQRGSAVVETLFTVILSVAILAGGFTMTYLAFARMWLQRAAYELNICLSTSEIVYRCEQTFRAMTSQALPIGQIEHLVSSPGQDRVEVHFSWRLTRDFALKIEDHRPLPLIGPFDGFDSHLKERFP